MKVFKGIVFFTLLGVFSAVIYLKPWRDYVLINKSYYEKLSHIDTTTRYKLYTPEGFKLIKQTSFDSLLNVKNKIVIVKKEVPVPVVDNEKVYYHDSLKTNDFTVHLYDTISKGIIIPNVL